MTIFVKKNGNWETINEVYLKESGSWVPVLQVWYRNEAQYLNVPPLAPTSYNDYYLNVFSDPSDPAYLFDNTFWLFQGGQGLLDPDPLYPAGGSGSIQVPYGCNRGIIYMNSQGGAGAESASFGVYPGSGGAGSFIDTQPFAINEFETINWSVSAPNSVGIGNGANGADVTISWAGNVLTCGGGGGGFTNGTQGSGGVHSGSGPVYAAATKGNGFPGEAVSLLIPFGRGGPFLTPGNTGGGSVYFYSAFSFYAEGGPVEPNPGCGGGGGFNSYGQRGGRWRMEMIFYFEP